MKLTEIMTAVQAATTAKTVSLDVFKERLNTCSECQYLRSDPFYDYCSICRCRVSNVHTRIFNLAGVEENLPLWGCKHPNRKGGEGWQR